MPSNGRSWPDPEARPTIHRIVWTMTVVTTSEVVTKPKHGMPSRQTRCRGPGHSVQLGARDDGMHLPGRTLRVRSHVPVGGIRCRIIGLIRRPDTFALLVPSDEPVVPVPERVVEDDRAVPVRALPRRSPVPFIHDACGTFVPSLSPRAMYAATAATATTIGETVPVFESVFGFNGEGIRCTPVIRFKYWRRIPVSWPAEA